MEKTTKVIIAVLVVIVLAIIAYFVIKPGLLGSPISCYVRCNSNDNCGTNSVSSVCNGTNLCTTSIKYTCAAAGSQNSSCLTSVGTGCSPCAYGCSNGACNPTPTCTDSDGGLNLNVRGNTTGIQIGTNNTIVSNADICWPYNNNQVDEYFCSGSYVNNAVYNCPTGQTCNNGVCIVQNQTCTDTCSSKGYQCGAWQLCNKNVSCGTCVTGQTCNNGVCITTTNSTATCKDSDNDGANPSSQNFFLKGNVTACTGQSCTTVSDICSGNKTLIEYYCTTNNAISQTAYTCLNTTFCTNGACK